MDGAGMVGDTSGSISTRRLLRGLWGDVGIGIGSDIEYISSSSNSSSGSWSSDKSITFNLRFVLSKVRSDKRHQSIYHNKDTLPDPGRGRTVVVSFP